MTLFLLGLQAGLHGPARAEGLPQAKIEMHEGWSDWDSFADALAHAWSDFTGVLREPVATDVPLMPTIVHMRTACPRLKAGLPADCSTAARLVCHRHGFASGRELDLESGEVCRGDALVAGHGLHAGHCKPKIWITQAACW